MATRSRIAYSDWDVVSAYHHWDGYPEGVGMHLVKHFPTLEDAKKLVNGGDMSSCMHEDGVVYYGDYPAQQMEGSHNRGEKWEDTKPKHHDCVDDYGSPLCTRISGVENFAGLEYLYIHMKGQWHVSDNGIDWDPVVDVAKEAA